MRVAIEERPPAPVPPIPRHLGVGRLLDELESLLLVIPPALYETVPTGGGATIGQNVGRCLDLIETWLSVGSARVIAYRRRDEHTAVDTDPAHALRTVRALRAAVRPEYSLDRVIRVEEIVEPFGDLDRAWSTVGNELAFIVNGVVDRQKVIGRVMASFGFSVPEAFGSMEPPPLRARSSVPPSWALWRLLDELGSLLIEVAPDVYTARLAAATSGTIGQHVRHCLDHVSALLAADASTTLSYDRRRRGTAGETDPVEALHHVLRLKGALDAWSMRPLDEPIRVTSIVSTSGDAVTGWSTLARELAFVVSHTIHHQAIIAVLLATQGQTVPDRFGCSPSTPRRN